MQEEFLIAQGYPDDTTSVSMRLPRQYQLIAQGYPDDTTAVSMRLPRQYQLIAQGHPDDSCKDIKTKFAMQKLSL
jgi:hypothetical protein